jgi:flagellar hook protein FlgE
MGALGAAISGLQSSQKWLDVISNNVSNSQTVAYKQGRLTFSDLISDGLRAPSGPNNTSNLGGINPTQLGLGVTVGSIQTIMKQGAMQTTGNVTDVAINGTGFLTVSKGQSTLYTRAGNLTFDQQGNLVTTDGGLVQGWTSTINRTAGPPMVITGPALNTANPAAVGNIQIPNNLVLAPKATSNQLSPTVKDQGVIIKGNLDNNTPANILGGGFGTAGFIPDATTTFVVYDSLGTAYTMQLSFEQTAATPINPASWTWYLNDITGGVLPTGVNQISTGGPLTFNPDGSLLSNGNAGVNPTIAVATVNGSVAPFNFSLNFGTDNTANATGTPPLGLRDGLTGDYGSGSFDAFGVYTPVQTVYTADVDGYSEGTLLGLSFNQTGGVDATFSNGENVEVAKLALTKFDNQDGLTRVGGNYFARTANSGMGQVGVGGANGFGTVQGGALEASNVDLTVELTNMILAQRMFESSARVVTAADKVLETLVNLGR